jgi:methionyl-tRNA formyltransferase
VRIVFFGTPAFAAHILNHILRNSSHKVVAVVSRPDAPSGRGRHLQPTPVKKAVQEYNEEIPILQPLKASSPEVAAQLQTLSPDIFLVVAYGEILRKNILEIPSKGCFNIHASLLPEYRGAAPIQRALMNGCSKTGVTFMRMGEGMDSGDIVVQRSCAVSEKENAGELTEKLLKLSLELIDDALARIKNGTAPFTPQQHALATYAPKIQPEDLVLNDVDDIWQIHNRVRSLSPAPGAYFWIQLRGEKKRLKILRTHLDQTLCDAEHRWKCSSEGYLALCTAEGALVFDEVQLEGKAAISSKEFLRGTPLEEVLFL